MARYILMIEPFASTPAADLAQRIGPTLQGYIEGLPA
jgi:hypothetical protein